LDGRGREQFAVSDTQIQNYRHRRMLEMVGTGAGLPPSTAEKIARAPGPYFFAAPVPLSLRVRRKSSNPRGAGDCEATDLHAGF
jgi:hypothetical protein